MGLVDRWIRRFAATPAEAARKIQMTGLVRTAKVTSTVLRRPAPDADEIPTWIRRVFEQVTARMCDYDDPQMPDPRDCGAVDAALDFLEGTPPQTRRELQSLLVLVELSPLVVGPTRRRFTELEADAAAATLRRWERSPLEPMRGAFRALKSMVMMGYWSRPETFPVIDYSVAENPGVPQPQTSRWERREGEK